MTCGYRCLTLAEFYGDERATVERYEHRVFWIGPRKGPGEAWADTFEDHHAAIARYSRTPGPYVVKVQRHGLKRVWP